MALIGAELWAGMGDCVAGEPGEAESAATVEVHTNLLVTSCPNL